jgi:hypothetical protein
VAESVTEPESEPESVPESATFLALVPFLVLAPAPVPGPSIYSIWNQYIKTYSIWE